MIKNNFLRAMIYGKAEDSITLEKLMQEWLTVKKSTVKAATYHKYQCIVNRHFLSAPIGKLHINNITSRVIAEFSRDKLITLKPGSVNDILAVLSLALNFAHTEYKYSKPHIPYVRKEKKEMRVLSLCEQKKLEEYLYNDMNPYKLGVLIALYTGIRLGELCALTWEDITAEHITVSKTLHRLNVNGKTTVAVTEPKTESSNRKIPIPSFISDILEKHRSTGFVLKNRNGKTVEPRLMQQAFKKIIADCGIDKTNFHALRHTFATRCVEVGFDIKSLSEILGHSDVKTTLNKYVHSSFEQKKKNMELLIAVNM